jgi:glutaredoxin-related protein
MHSGPWCDSSKRARLAGGKLHRPTSLQRHNVRVIRRPLNDRACCETPRTVQIFIGGEFIGGASELLSLMDQGKFKSMLSSASNRSFPDPIAKLIKQHVSSNKDSGPSEVEQQGAALASTLEKDVAWNEVKVGCAPAPSQRACIHCMERRQHCCVGP